MCVCVYIYVERKRSREREDRMRGEIKRERKTAGGEEEVDKNTVQKGSKASFVHILKPVKSSEFMLF